MPLIGYLAVSLIIFGLDQLVKYLVVTYIKLDTTVSFIPNVISLSNVRNDGAAWSILQGAAVIAVCDYGGCVSGHACFIEEKSK